VPRNYGWELHHLNPRTGEAYWRHPRPYSIRRIHEESLAVTGDLTCFVAGRHLYALKLGDGQVRWRRPLPGPDVPWRVEALEGVLLAYPVYPRGVAREESAAVALLGGSNPCGVVAQLKVARMQTLGRPRPVELPVLLVQPQDGHDVFQETVTAEGSQAAVQVAGSTLCVVLGDRAFGLASN
jgi:hypothetical protein